VVLVLALVAAGCGGSEPDELSPLGGSPATSTTSLRPTGAAPSTTEPLVELVQVLDHGAEPRREVRLMPAVGSVERITTRIDATQRMEYASGWEDVPVPIFELDQSVTVTSVDGGRIMLQQVPYAYRIVDGRGLDPVLLGEYDRIFDLLLELTSTTIVLDPRGQVLDQTMVGEAAEYDLPSFEGLVTTTADLSLPVPLDPIGVGARWRVETDSVVSAMRMISVIDLELVEMDGERAVARFTQSVTLPRGFIEGSFDRDEVLGGELRSTGTVTWRMGGTLALVDQESSGVIRLSMFRGRDRYHTAIDQHLRRTMFLRD
jgi:hypothetical protein